MKRTLLPILMMLIMLSACNKATPTAAPTETPTPTPLAPTPTTLPMAVRVNGEGILLSDYQAQLGCLQQTDSTLATATTPEQQRDRLVNNYIDQLLLAQAAAQNGFTLDDATLQARIDKLTSDTGADKFAAWLTANCYTPETFKAADRLEITADWQRDQIINAVPTTAEQIHALQILFQDEANAKDAYQKLKDGTNFAELALKYDPITGGDLGWFAAGTLTQPAVDAAAFALQPGQYSDVIKSDFGYHIIYVVDRDPQHPLSVDGRRILQDAALAKWLEAARKASKVEILVQ